MITCIMSTTYNHVYVDRDRGLGGLAALQAHPLTALKHTRLTMVNTHGLYVVMPYPLAHVNK